jgi:hypothetical protein
MPPEPLRFTQIRDDAAEDSAPAWGKFPSGLPSGPIPGRIRALALALPVQFIRVIGGTR